MKNFAMALAVVAGVSMFALSGSAEAGGCGYGYRGGYSNFSGYNYGRSYNYGYSPRVYNYGHNHGSFYRGGFNNHYHGYGNRGFYGNRGPSFGIQSGSFGLYIR